MERYEGPNEADLSGDPNWVADTQYMTKLIWDNHNTSYPVVGPSLTTEAAYASLGDLSAYMDFGNMHNYFDGFYPGTNGWGSTDKFGTYATIQYSINSKSLPIQNIRILTLLF